MNRIPRVLLDSLRAAFPEGTRVQLVKMDDEQAPPVGTVGTVKWVDDVGTIHINWENGSRLGAAWPEDKVEKVSGKGA